MKLSRRGIILIFIFLAGLLCAQAPSPKHKIGLVFDSNGRGDRSYNDLAFEGLVEIAKIFNGYFTTAADPKHGNELEIKYLRPARDSAEARLTALNQLGREGHQLVFAVGFLFNDVLSQAARANPNTHFVLIDGSIPNLQQKDNITVVKFREHEGSFIAGMVAGIKSDGGKVGFIGGMNTEDIQRFEVGFRAGVVWANPALRAPGQILVEYIGNDASAFNNPNRAYQIARRMYRSGASVIYHASGGSGMGLFQAALEARKLAIGVDSDQGMVLAFDRDPQIQEQAKWVLTSMIKRVNRPILLLARDFILSGRIPNRYYNLGLDFDAIGLAVNQMNRELLGPALIQQISDTRIRITDQEIIVPSNYRELEKFLRN